MTNLDAARQFAADLTGMGCDLALDDFGTGFGSFTYLKHLPARYLKIDMEFVRELADRCDRPGDRAGDLRDRAQPRQAHCCRGCRERRRAIDADRLWRRLRPGLLHRQAEADLTADRSRAATPRSPAASRPPRAVVWCQPRHRGRSAVAVVPFVSTAPRRAGGAPGEPVDARLRARRALRRSRGGCRRGRRRPRAEHRGADRAPRS